MAGRINDERRGRLGERPNSRFPARRGIGELTDSERFVRGGFLG
jgi:hypothetical protein